MASCRTASAWISCASAALFYQSLDGTLTGWWNPNSREFEQLGDGYRLPVSDGLAIARNQVAPDLVRLPVPAPRKAEQ